MQNTQQQENQKLPTAVEIRTVMASLIENEDYNYFKVSIGWGILWVLFIGTVLGHILLPHFDSLKIALPIIAISALIESACWLTIFITSIQSAKYGMKYSDYIEIKPFLKSVYLFYNYTSWFTVLGICVYFIVAFAIYIENTGSVGSTFDVLSDLFDFVNK